MLRIALTTVVVLFISHSQAAYSQCFVQYDLQCDEVFIDDWCSDTDCHTVNNVWTCQRVENESIVLPDSYTRVGHDWYYGSSDWTDSVPPTTCVKYYGCKTGAVCRAQTFYTCESDQISAGSAGTYNEIEQGEFCYDEDGDGEDDYGGEEDSGGEEDCCDEDC